MGRHFERVSLASSDSRGHHSLLPKWNRECGPLRGALPRSHTQPQASPFFSPFTLHTQAASAPLPGRGWGSEAQLRVWFGSLGRFGAVQRVKSASCPEKKLEMQVAALSRGYAGAPALAILPQGVCEREQPCPVLQVPTKSRVWARGDGPGSGSRVPAQLSTPWQFSVQTRWTRLPRR